jgi:hypothetical protein
MCTHNFEPNLRSDIDRLMLDPFASGWSRIINNRLEEKAHAIHGLIVHSGFPCPIPENNALLHIGSRRLHSPVRSVLSKQFDDPSRP